ncbi:MAG: hypothetical protein E3K37_16575 [Candidatus Kuenenia sp.]|nr:hypothetical protein [Candidatus Kuenenia hertensis]
MSWHLSGSAYNVGGNEINLSLLETTRLCETITGNKITIKSEPSTRPADLPIYITSNQKIYNTLNWKPKRNAGNILNDIYLWINDNEKTLSALIN